MEFQFFKLQWKKCPHLSVEWLNTFINLQNIMQKVTFYLLQSLIYLFQKVKWLFSEDSDLDLREIPS